MAVQQPDYDVIGVGAGFSGLYLVHKMRELGLSVKVFEAGEGVGGTWYWNRYPGARCDSESMFYSFSFSSELEQEWEWTERYPTQPEILRYLNFVADRLELRSDIQFSTKVTSAHYDAQANLWRVGTSDGATATARYLVTGVGCLSLVNEPPFPGLDRFEGEWYQTSRWPHEGVDFAGKRVGFVGTGSTGIQAVPTIAKECAALTVFQRTPNFSLPAHNYTLSEEYKQDVKANFPELRQAARLSPGGQLIDGVETRSALEVSDEERERVFQAAWDRGQASLVFSFPDLMTNEQANAYAAEFVIRKIRETVKDPRKAELLIPTDHPIGSKRICIDSFYYDAFNEDHVDIVDVRSDPIAEITPKGIRLESGAEHELDILVFAIGFDAMTGPLFAMDIRGRDGLKLKDKWEGGPRTYLGLQTAGFPNLFMITGPGSPSVLSNMPVSIEQHVEFVGDFLDYMRENGYDTVEPDLQAEDEWVDHVNELANGTLYVKANSWYVGANVPGKPRVFMPYVGGVGTYRQHCTEVAAKGYEGFVLSAAGAPAEALVD